MSGRVENPQNGLWTQTVQRKIELLAFAHSNHCLVPERSAGWCCGSIWSRSIDEVPRVSKQLSIRFTVITLLAKVNGGNCHDQYLGSRHAHQCVLFGYTKLVQDAGAPWIRSHDLVTVTTHAKEERDTIGVFTALHSTWDGFQPQSAA